MLFFKVMILDTSYLILPQHNKRAIKPFIVKLCHIFGPLFVGGCMIYKAIVANEKIPFFYRATLFMG